MAYYVSDRELAASALRRFLAVRLTPDAVPTLFVRVDRLPLTSNGKVDRAALQASSPGPRPLQQPYVPPETETERALVEIWAATLGLDRVGIRENYFELGGDSIRCIQIIHAARARGVRFSPRDLFDHPTVAELAALARTAARPSTDHAPHPATASDDELREILEELD